MTEPKVLVFDIETAPMLAYIFGRQDQNISINQIYEDWYVLAWSAKWLGEPASKIVYRDQRGRKNPQNDKAILKVLWHYLDEADVVITQNGKNFDAPKLNARFILHGMRPPSPYTHFDTYQIARRVAKFTSNSLDYLTSKLCVKYKKLHRTKFPGIALWKECLAGNPAAWDEMKRYNIRDTLATEELYYIIRAWAPPTAPFTHAVQALPDCGTCGGKLCVQKAGQRRTKQGLYQRRMCTLCGSWSKPTRIKEPKSKTGGTI